MPKVKILLTFSLFWISAFSQNEDSIFIKKIFNQALTEAECYQNLDYLCNSIGARLSGSTNATKAVDYTKSVLEKSGYDKVYLQKVNVPHWVRGEKETASVTYFVENSLESDKKVLDKNQMIKIKHKKLNICALGGSVATTESGIAAKIIEVSSFEQLDSLGKNGVAGKIVFYNKPMDATKINTFEAYGPAVKFRSRGAIAAAKYGAVAVVVRSVTTAIDNYPHTGAMRYVDTIPKIPACAISTIDANWLSENLKQNPNTELLLTMSCQTLPDAESANVIGELKGRKNTEYIIVGGHLDSWDLAQGAHDDGAGVVQSIEALRILKQLGYKPKHTLRTVLFMNEENGLKGGEKYAADAKINNEKHLVAIETDAGGFAPRGFTSECNNATKKLVATWANLFAPYNINDFEKNGGGADIYALKEQGTALFELMPESQRYFDYHHSALDTFDKINKRELELGAASIAAFVYLFDKYIDN